MSTLTSITNRKTGQKFEARVFNARYEAEEFAIANAGLDRGLRTRKPVIDLPNGRFAVCL